MPPAPSHAPICHQTFKHFTKSHAQPNIEAFARLVVNTAPFPSDTGSSNAHQTIGTRRRQQQQMAVDESLSTLLLNVSSKPHRKSPSLSTSAERAAAAPLPLSASTSDGHTAAAPPVVLPGRLDQEIPAPQADGGPAQEQVAPPVAFVVPARPLQAAPAAYWDLPLADLLVAFLVPPLECKQPPPGEGMTSETAWRSVARRNGTGLPAAVRSGIERLGTPAAAAAAAAGAYLVMPLFVDTGSEPGDTPGSGIAQAAAACCRPPAAAAAAAAAAATAAGTSEASAVRPGAHNLEASVERGTAADMDLGDSVHMGVRLEACWVTAAAAAA